MNKIVMLTFFTLLSSSGVAQTDGSIRIKHYNLEDRVAVDGYDLVSYFDHSPREGSNEVTVIYKGITYYFSGEANASKFRADPEKYEPAYGGWCAYAMGATGEKVKVDPETYKIIDGRLYLFYNFWGNNTLDDWNKNQVGLQASADRNWQQAIE